MMRSCRSPSLNGVVRDAVQRLEQRAQRNHPQAQDLVTEPAQGGGELVVRTADRLAAVRSHLHQPITQRVAQPVPEDYHFAHQVDQPVELVARATGTPVTSLEVSHRPCSRTRFILRR